MTPAPHRQSDRGKRDGCPLTSIMGGDGDCPVCGRPGALTGLWRQATEQEVARLTAEAQGQRTPSVPLLMPGVWQQP